MFNCLLDSSWREEYIDIGIRECSWGHCSLQRLCRQRQLVGLSFPLLCEVGWSGKGKIQVQRSLLNFLLCESVLILSCGCCYAKFFWRSASRCPGSELRWWMRKLCTYFNIVHFEENNKQLDVQVSSKIPSNTLQKPPSNILKTLPKLPRKYTAFLWFS